MVTTPKAAAIYSMVPPPAASDPLWRHLTIRSYDAVSPLSSVNYSSDHAGELKISAARPLIQHLSTAQSRALNELFVPLSAQVKIAQSGARRQITVTATGAGYALPRISVTIASQDTSMTIQFRNTRRVSLNSAVLSFECAESSSGTIVLEIATRPDLDQFYSIDVWCRRSSSIVLIPILTGDGHARLDITLHIAAPDVHARVLGLDLAHGDAEHAIITNQLHNSGASTSLVEVRSLMGDNSRSVYHGLIKIAKGADATDAYQKNSALLLSARAKVHTTPKLEIEANDVRCTHGATCAPLDSDQLFYLRTRGIPEQRAAAMLQQAFACGHLTSLTDKHVLSYITKIITKEMSRHV